MTPRSSTTSTVPDASIPDSVLSGEKTLGEYIDDKIAAHQMAGEVAANKERLVAALVTGSAEYDEGDRATLKQTPVPILETLVRDAPGVSDATPTANVGDDIDVGDFSTGEIASRTTPTANVSGDDPDSDGPDDPDADDFGTGVIG